MYSLYDRIIDPFSTKLGIDTLPDFVPTEHYKQVLYFCNEALDLIDSKKNKNFKLSEIKFFLDEYEELFDETEIWIKLYSNFEPFSLVYLELCELKVFIEDYGKICDNSMKEINNFKTSDWVEKYKNIYNHILQTIEFESKEFIDNENFVPIKNSNYLIQRIEVLIHLEFFNLFNNINLKVKYD